MKISQFNLLKVNQAAWVCPGRHNTDAGHAARGKVDATMPIGGTTKEVGEMPARGLSRLRLANLSMTQGGRPEGKISSVHLDNEGNATSSTINVYPPYGVQIIALGTNTPGEILAGYAAEVGFPMSTSTQGYAR